MARDDRSQPFFISKGDKNGKKILWYADKEAPEEKANMKSRNWSHTDVNEVSGDVRGPDWGANVQNKANETCKNSQTLQGQRWQEEQKTAGAVSASNLHGKQKMRSRNPYNQGIKMTPA